MSEIVRVLRVLEYIGERKWVEDTLARSSVPLNGASPIWGKRGKDDYLNGYIKSGMIGTFPEVVQDHEYAHPDHNAIENIKKMLQEKIEYHAEHRLIIDGANAFRYMFEYVEEVQKKFNLMGELGNVEEDRK